GKVDAVGAEPAVEGGATSTEQGHGRVDEAAAQEAPLLDADREEGIAEPEPDPGQEGSDTCEWGEHRRRPPGALGPAGAREAAEGFDGGGQRQQRARRSDQSGEDAGEGRPPPSL